jgi:LAO/AO transport system kinase
MKAGILEIADIYVVNKADLTGADGQAREIRAMLSLGARLRDDVEWSPPVVKVSSNDRTGLDGLIAAITRHEEHLRSTEEGVRRRRGAARQEIQDQIDAIVRSKVASRQGASQLLIDEVAGRSMNPRDAALNVLAELTGDQRPA